MTKSNQLLAIFADAVKAGGGVLTAAELAFMQAVPYDAAFTKLLSDCVKKDLLRRLGSGVFESCITPCEPTVAIYQVIKKMRPGVLTYISLESQLSYTGEISQQVLGRVTLMTKGRSGTFVTPYGVIELTHTKKPSSQIMPNLYFDAEIKMYRANRAQALADLKDCGRNLHMLET